MLPTAELFKTLAYFCFCFSANTELIIFEEIQPNELKKIDNLEQDLDELEDITSGDIFVFQKQLTGNEDYRWETTIKR